jgi:hypothetical protein
MANFTDTELEAAVSQFVRTDVKTERTDLGPLSTDYAFEEMREFASSTMVFSPGSIFYLLSLAANRVNQDVIQAIEYLNDVLTAIDEVGRDTQQVTQTSLLEDAAAALIEVERTIESNNAIAARPFARYTRALDAFTANSLTPNVRRLGLGTAPDNVYEIVRPPQKAQSAIKANIAELRDLHEAIVAEATQLTVAMSEFLAANLPLVSIQNTIPKVRNDLRSLKSQFDAATRDGAIEITRDAFLSINAGRSVVTNLTSISDPRVSRMGSTAASTDRAQATYPSSSSTPAELTTDISAPYKITPTTDEIRLIVDSGVEQLVTLPLSEQAEIVGSRGENYDINTSAVNALLSGGPGPFSISAPDNIFDIYADGVGYRVTLTTGSRTAAQVAGEVNGATRIDGQPGTFGAVGNAYDLVGQLFIQHSTAGEHTLSLGDRAVLNVLLGFTNLESDTGAEANNQLRLIVDDVNAVVLTLFLSGTRTAASVAAELDAGSAMVSVTTETITTDSGSIEVLKFSSAEYGEESHIRVDSLTSAQEELVETLGLFEGQEDRGAYSLLEDLDQAIQDGVIGVETEQSRTVLAGGGSGEALLDGAVYKIRLPAGSLYGVSITDDDSLWIANGENVGWYDIIGVVIGGPLYEEISVGRPFPASSGVEALNQAWSLVRDVLTVRSTSVDTNSRLQVNAATANTEVGLSPAEYLGSVSGVEIKDGTKFLNFSRADVAIGDRFTLKGPIYVTEHTVSDVTEDGYQIEVTPEVPNDLAAHEYQIDSEGALAYSVFIDELNSWFSDVLAPSKFADDIQELERVLNPLLVNKNPSAALIGAADNTADALLGVYLALSSLLESFMTLVVPRVDALLDMLRERGLDRAHDLLLLGEFEEFFGATKDGASYGGNLLEKMRSIAQNDVPQGRGFSSDNVDDRLTSSYEGSDAEFDFSDQDNESGITEIDDVPDLTDDEDALNRSL